MRYTSFHVVRAAIVAFVGACSTDATAPGGASPLPPTHSATAWGPESPNFNLEVVLRGSGFGLVNFRQPNDDARVIYLDTRVRDLAPNTAYALERAVDTNLDGACSSTSWLRLGDGLTPMAITTDARGTGRAELWRDVATIALGARFDIHFRVVNATTSAVVLTSDCYEYVVSQ